MPTIAPHELLDLIARAHKRTGIAVDELGDGGVSLLRWMATRHRVSMLKRDGQWSVSVGDKTYTEPTLLLAALRAVDE